MVSSRGILNAKKKKKKKKVKKTHIEINVIEGWKEDMVNAAGVGNRLWLAQENVFIFAILRVR